jgi:glyoxylase-like metal-dependent hydrolase (beta-lactamase superfamily II)
MKFMVCLMDNVERVADDLYVIKQPSREGWTINSTVVFGTDRIGMVDTGFEETPVDFIFPAILKLGRKPEEINLIVNTHRDGDHVRGNKVVKEKTEAKIAIHELEAEAVETVDIKLKDGDTVELGDRKFTVLHTPGHRPGSICLYDQKNRILITGDSVLGNRTDLISMDKKIYISSLNGVVDLDIEVMVMSHPFQPLGKSILTGKEPKEMIKESIKMAEKS